MDFDYITVDEFKGDWIDQTGHEGHFEEDLIDKYAQDEAERLMRGSGSKEFISLLNVEDYTAKLPDNHQRNVQAAYNIFPQKCPTKTEISQFTQQVFGSGGCELKINLECPKCHKTDCDCGLPVVEVDADYLYNVSHPEHEAMYWDHFSSYVNLTDDPRDRRSQYHPQFRVMYPKMNDFWNIQYNVNECNHITVDNEISYLIDKPNIVVNFQEGQILLNYLGLRLDGDGKSLIPNDPDIINAIVLYIEKMLSRAQYRNTLRKDIGQYYTMTKNEYLVAHKKARMKIDSKTPQELAQSWRNIMMKRDFQSNRADFNRRRPDTYRLPGQTSGRLR